MNDQNLKDILRLKAILNMHKAMGSPDQRPEWMDKEISDITVRLIADKPIQQKKEILLELFGPESWAKMEQDILKAY